MILHACAGSQFHACALFPFRLFMIGRKSARDLNDVGVRRRLLLCETSAF